MKMMDTLKEVLVELSEWFIVMHMNLNEELLDANLGYLESRFCDSSEFANDSWAQKHGC